MKYLFYIFILVFSSTVLHAQKDTIIAENIFKYELHDGKATKNRTIIRQNTYNLENQLIKQINYDSSAEIQSSILFFYKDNLLISKETFGADFVLDSVRRITYNSSGKRTTESLYVIRDSIPEKTDSRQYFYENGELIKDITFSSRKKWKVKRMFENSESICTETQLFKKGASPMGLKKRTVTYTFNGDNPASAVITSKYFNKEVSISKVGFKYDSINHLLISKSLYKENDSSLREIQFSYYPDGNIRFKKTFSSSGEFTEFLMYKRTEHNIAIGKPEMYIIPEDN